MRTEATKPVGVSLVGVFYIGLGNCWIPSLTLCYRDIFPVGRWGEMVTAVGWDLRMAMLSPSDRPLRRMETVGSLLTAAFGQACPPPLSCLLARVEWGGVGWEEKLGLD